MQQWTPSARGLHGRRAVINDLMAARYDRSVGARCKFLILKTGLRRPGAGYDEYGNISAAAAAATLIVTHAYNRYTVLTRTCVSTLMGGSVAEWLACWTQAQKGPGSNRSRYAVG